MEHLPIELIKNEICNYLSTIDKIFLCLTCKRFSEITRSNISACIRDISWIYDISTAFEHSLEYHIECDDIFKSKYTKYPYRFSIVVTTGNVGLIKQFINDVDSNFVKIAYKEEHFQYRVIGHIWTYHVEERNDLFFHEVRYTGLNKNINRIHKYIVNKCINDTILDKDSKEKLLGMLNDWVSNINKYPYYQMLPKIEEQILKRYI